MIDYLLAFLIMFMFIDVGLLIRNIAKLLKEREEGKNEIQPQERKT